MTIPTKGTQSGALYVQGPSPGGQDTTSLQAYLQRELEKLSAVVRKIDERLKAGGL